MEKGLKEAMKKAIILLLGAALLVSLSACHTAEPTPESSQPVLSSYEPVSSMPESSAPSSEPSSETETSRELPSSEAVSSRAEAPVSSQAPPPASSNAPKPASSQAPKQPASSTPPPASSEPEPTVELPEELKPYRRPLDVDRIIADMVQAGEALGMTYDESLTKEHSAWKPYDETNIFPDGDEPNFKKQAADNVIYVYDYIMAVEPDALPEQIHFRPYLEPIGNGEYNIYVFYG